MIILGIETSCDETALSIIDIRESADGGKEIKILANKVLSQIELHKQYGGVFPMMAKREHSRNLIPLFKKTLKESGFLESRMGNLNHSHILQNVRMILEREPEMLPQFLEFIPSVEKPPIDLIAVTSGPGLEPCLWVGINFAKALSVVWNTPVVPTNHMEGHILISLLKRNEENHKSQITKFNQTPNDKSKIPNGNPAHYTLNPIPFPALSLLISGGHTELVLMKKDSEYEIVGRTRDDAVGEAFDKVARILGLPYPGGPEISHLAEVARVENSSLKKGRSLRRYVGEGGESASRRISNPSSEDGVLPFTKGEFEIALPRPMLHSDNLDFSFSGLKTAVLYLVQKLTQTDEISVREGLRPIGVSQRVQSLIAREFEDAATEVIVEKVRKAVETYGVQTLILGGGVVANKNIRTAFEKLMADMCQPGRLTHPTLKLPAVDHATDNALMIAIAGYFNKTKALTEITGLLELKADGNLHF